MLLSCDQHRSESIQGGSSFQRLGPPTSGTVSSEWSIRGGSSRIVMVAVLQRGFDSRASSLGRVWTRGRTQGLLVGPVHVDMLVAWDASDATGHVL